MPDNLPFDDSRFFFSHITADDIIKSVSWSGSEAVGVDGIPVSFIKLTLPYTLSIVYICLTPPYSNPTSITFKEIGVGSR